MDSWIDELERDLGLPARLAVLANCGGQNRDIPSVERAARSKLASEIGVEATIWLAKRFAGTKLEIPSRLGAAARDRASQLRAAVMDAGLGENPTRSANDIASEFNVTARWVHELRAQLRNEHLHATRQLRFPF
ncbi:hypothetical protein [Maritimibacter alkaliphilus]|uniref:hypothetical protein n=1 Tax=Maritimibacter alkaliphilus TaxID=404236 RepID=UPI001C938395|nr:hypothetical protein [Maritimibacter alkaliphilus]MBY6091055.1 hypothetical protein [Maritimibacter alkaliphilus]